MVTGVPTMPVVGVMLVILGSNMKITPLLATPFTVTTRFPVVAPSGTGTTMHVALQLVGVAAVPLKVTVLLPCAAPKFVPVIVTSVPHSPELGDKLAMVGVGKTVKGRPLLEVPPTVTTTFPLVAPGGTCATIERSLHATTLAEVPLKVTLLLPCVAPKFAPVIIT